MLGCGWGLAQETAKGRSGGLVASQDRGRLLSDGVDHALTSLSGPSRTFTEIAEEVGDTARSWDGQQRQRLRAVGVHHAMRQAASLLQHFPSLPLHGHCVPGRLQASLWISKPNCGHSTASRLLLRKPVIQGRWQARLALASGQGLSLRQPSSNLGFSKSALQNPCVPGNSSIRSALTTNHCPDPASQGGGRGAPSQPIWTKAGSLESKKCVLFTSVSSTGTHTMYNRCAAHLRCSNFTEEGS